MTKVIGIVGNGCAALESIKALRENGYEGDIHLFSDSIWPSYNPMLVTYYAAGKIDFDTLFPYGASDEFYKKYNVKLHQGSKVIKLDAIGKTIENDAGVVINYDKALIASGASPFMPPIEGIDNENIYKVRTVEDAIELKNLMKTKEKRVLVIGASMVGIKMVEMFIKSGFDVTFADMAKNIFPLAAHKNCSDQIEALLEKKGVKLKFNSGINKIEKTKNGLNAYFTGDDNPIEVDHIIMSIGVRANLSFIDRDQVEVKGGIIVDQYMQTNCEGLYAAGDVAQGNNILTNENQVIGLWANGRYQGKTAGINMAGKKQVYHGTLVHNITHFLDIDFIGVGNVNDGDKVFEEYGEDGTYVRLVWDKNKLIGINLLNTPEISGVLKGYLIKGLNISQNYPLEAFENNTFAMNKLYKVYPKLKNILTGR